MNSTQIAPSRIARTMAGQLWPDVQFQKQIAKGVYGFSCAGHGGIVAVIGVADLNEQAVEIARAEGKTEFVGQYYGRMLTSEKYTPETFERMQERGMPVWEVLVGEEDCDWAVVLMSASDPEATLAGARGKYLATDVTLEDVCTTVKSWNPDFFEALTGEVIPVEDSYIKGERKFAEDNKFKFVVRSAWGSWHEKVPAGFVGVVASIGDGQDERWFLVPEARYDARQGKFIITDEQEWVDHA